MCDTFTGKHANVGRIRATMAHSLHNASAMEFYDAMFPVIRNSF